MIDLRHDIYALAIGAARRELPVNARMFLFRIARNHLIDRARRARIVSFDGVADLETVDRDIDLFAADRHLSARDTLRRVQKGMERLSPRVGEIVRLRKLYGLDTRETAERLGIGKDAVERQLSLGMKALADFLLGGSGKIVRKTYGRSAREGGEA